MSTHENRGSGSLLRILVAPFLLLSKIPPLAGILIFLLLGMLAFGAYYSLNSDFFGLAAPPLEELTFSQDYQHISAPDGRTWSIQFEYDQRSIFRGVVRYVSHWREEDIPFATHDILVTSGEFTSRARVHVSVLFHTFTFRYDENPYPSGTIHLLHIVPATPEIYRQLLQVREWNSVEISGREILRIERYAPDGRFLSYWQDAGCNSILVDSVTLLDPGTPVP
jgi:hypothetical protein